MAKPTSLYIDLEKRTEPMQEYGIKGTDVYLSQASPHTLGRVPGFDDLQYATPDYNRYSDLYGLYLNPFEETATAGNQPGYTTPPSDGGTGGTTTGGTGINTGGDNTYIGGGATLEDAGGVPELGGVYATDYQGEGVGDLADYPLNENYTPPTSDPFLVSGAAGGARLPEGPQGGSPGILNPATYANTGDPDLLELAGGHSGGADAYFEDDLMEYDEHYDMMEPTSQ